MRIIHSALPGVWLLEPEVHRDERGFLLETFRADWLRAAGIDAGFVQDNQSRSHRGVVRGLHYQRVNPQGKLVRTARGRVFDVAVDVRRGSPHFGEWVGYILDDVTHCQLWIPPGFAHGFCALSDEADVAYKCTAWYHAESNTGIAWDDPDIGIEWPEAGARLLSAKDRELPRLAEQRLEWLPVYGD